VGVIAKVLLGAVRRAQERITTVDRADDR
jgi:hypothetical protein